MGDERLLLSEEATAALQSYARRHQLTLNTLIQAAWALLLSRHAGTQEVLFGAVSSGRPAELPGVERMIGLFTTSLPIRITLPDNADLLSWLQSLQAQQIELRQYEHVDTSRLHGWSELPEGDSLFESVLVVENFPLEGTREIQASSKEAISQAQADGAARLVEHMRTASDLDVRDFHATVMRLTFPLMLTVLPQSELFLHIAYQSTRFEPETIQLMLAVLRSILEKLPHWSTVPVSELTARLPELKLLPEKAKASA